MVHSNQMPIATNSDKIILNSEKDTKEFAKNITYGKFSSCIKLVKFFKSDSITASSF